MFEIYFSGPKIGPFFWDDLITYKYAQRFICTYEYTEKNRPKYKIEIKTRKIQK